MKPARLYALASALALLLLSQAQYLEAQPVSEDELNLLCLKESYPEIKSLESDGKGGQWLILADGRRVPYALPGMSAVRESMSQSYPLEPERPDTPPGIAPGRKRPYELFEALYGRTSNEVRAGLVQANLNGRRISVSGRLKEPLQAVSAELAKIADPTQKRFLTPDGGFNWRKIAGEANQSAHSYGIAVDIGARHAPYWRWSKITPHPLQKTYPAAIVEAFERHGFIWGGKWHEYDLMHFEYRPELICKARHKKSADSAGAFGTGFGIN